MKADKQRMVCQIVEEKEQEDMLTHRLRLTEGRSYAGRKTNLGQAT
jgi:hypothetical protein